MGKLEPPGHALMTCRRCRIPTIHHILEDDGLNGAEHTECTLCGVEWKSDDLRIRSLKWRAIGRIMKPCDRCRNTTWHVVLNPEDGSRCRYECVECSKKANDNDDLNRSIF